MALVGALGLIGLGVGLTLRRMLFPKLARAVAATTSRIDDMGVAAPRGPGVVWGLLIGLYAGATLVQLPAAWDLVVRNLLIVLVTLSVSWSLARIAGGVVSTHATTAPGALPSARLLTNLVQVSILVLGGLRSDEHTS